MAMFTGGKVDISDTSFGQSVSDYIGGKSDGFFSTPSGFMSGVVGDLTHGIVSPLIEGLTGGKYETLADAFDVWTGEKANQDNLAYQREYNEQVFNRADTQYQRTVADLRAAGLSSQLAAGSPSTVAGASQAPQRTVGNESAAIEKLVGLVNSIKQTGASTKLAEAQANKANSEASLIDQEVASYSDRIAVELAYKKSATEYNRQQALLTQQIGQTKTQEIMANINKTLADTEYTKQLTENGKKQGELFDAETGKLKVDTEKSRKELEKLTHDITLLKEQISGQVLKNLNIGYENEILVEKVVQAAIDSRILQYNYDWSVQNGLRTTDQQTKLNIFGLGVSNMESLRTPEGYSAVSDPNRPYGL